MDEKCVVYRTVNIISKKWCLLVILSIHKGKNHVKRYNEIKKDVIGITPKSLSKVLNELVIENILIKKTNRTKVPIKTYYSLTESGKDLIKVVNDLKSWGLKWKFNNKKCENNKCQGCLL
ncbi:helix-turn-helix transcriptional regulator [Candidatus Pacearchaeota archaeon]|nr:helix-turn-helix transcriptional regulator [Candidatus Pacearchaeota archaeon]